MAQLISVKLKEEDSYFYDNKGAMIEKVGGDDEKKEVGKKMSKKERKASEREEKKEKKKQEKEQKQQEKEMKKRSKKVKQTSEEKKEPRPENGGVSHVNMAASVETLEDRKEGGTDEDRREPEDEGRASTDYREPMRAGPSGHVVEETITSVGASEAEEAPPDTMYQKREITMVNLESPPPDVQHVEIEISEVTDMEDEPTVSNYGNNNVVTYSGEIEGDSEIMVVTVQNVESSPDVDELFKEMSASPRDEMMSPKRKSVRFEEEHEEIEVNDRHEEELREKEQRMRGDPVVETMTKEERQNVESSELNWEDIFAEENDSPAGTRQTSGDDHREVVVDHREVVVDHREVVVDHRAVIEGNPSESTTTVQETQTRSPKDVTNNNNESIVANGTGSRHGEKSAKKDRSNRSKLWRCCYP